MLVFEEVILGVGEADVAFEDLGVLMMLEPMLLHLAQRFVIFHGLFDQELVTEDLGDHLFLQSWLVTVFRMRFLIDMIARIHLSHLILNGLFNAYRRFELRHLKIGILLILIWDYLRDVFRLSIIILILLDLN